MRAEVSTATVSRVRNGSANLNPATRERVLTAIRELDFVPNGAPRSLSIRSTRVIALVFAKPECEEELSEEEDERLLYMDMVIRVAEHAAQEQGFSLLLSGANGATAARTVTDLSGQVDGMLVLERVLPEAEAARLARRFPVVLVAGSGASHDVATVHVDNDTPVVELAHHLVVDHGHRDLAFVGARRDGSVEPSKRVPGGPTPTP